MKKWVQASPVSDFDSVDRKMVDLGGNLQIGLFKVSGDFYAISAWCSHQRATMVHGDLDGFELMCPLHGARFDIRNGQALSLPAVQAVNTYKVKVEDGHVLGPALLVAHADLQGVQRGVRLSSELLHLRKSSDV